MAQFHTLDDAIASFGYPPEVAAAVAKDVESQGTTQHILSGMLTLPHPTDAQQWHDAKQVAAGKQVAADATAETIRELQQRIAALEEQQHQQPEQH